MLRWLLLAVLALAIGVGLVYTLTTVWPALFDPAADPKRREPPPLRAAQVGEALLFDGATAIGFAIEGPSQALKSNLVLGGAEKCRAAVAATLAAPWSLEFDFYEAGRAPTRFLIEATEAGAEPKRFVVDLNLGNHVHHRWHHVKVDATEASGHCDWDVAMTPLHDGMGRSGRSSFTLPAAAGLKIRLLFETEPGSTLYLRNVILKGGEAKPTTPKPTPPAGP